MGNGYPVATNRAPEQEVTPASVNWWLRLTSSYWNVPQPSLPVQELARRSRLTSWVILTLLVVCVVLIPTGVGSPSTLIAVAAAFVVIVGAAVLNRIGRVTGAGALLVAIVIVADIGADLGSPMIDPLNLPSYDLLVLAVLVAACTLPPLATFVVMGVDIAAICADFFLQPQAPQLQQDANLYGVLALIARPIALQIIAGVIAFLLTSGMLNALRRASRAEEIATLEQRERERTRGLELGVQQLLQTHVRASNGDLSTRVQLVQGNELWQVGVSLNNLLNRLQSAAAASGELLRVRGETQRLIGALRDVRLGRSVNWSRFPRGTFLDPLIAEIAQQTGSAHPQSGPQGGVHDLRYPQFPDYPTEAQGGYLPPRSPQDMIRPAAPVYPPYSQDDEWNAPLAPPQGGPGAEWQTPPQTPDEPW